MKDPLSKSQIKRIEITKKNNVVCGHTKYVGCEPCGCEPTPLETHAKNLEWIDEDIKTIESIREHMGDYEYGLCGYKMVLPYLRTNRKVLELHKPFHYRFREWVCETCLSGYKADDFEPPYAFPCLTYSTITQGLGITE